MTETKDLREELALLEQNSMHVRGGDSLIRLRQLAGLDQTSAAMLSGLSESRLAAAESGDPKSVLTVYEESKFRCALLAAIRNRKEL